MPTTALYRLYDNDGELLYVGVTKNPGTGWRSTAQKAWWGDVAAPLTGPAASRAREAELRRNRRRGQGTTRGGQDRMPNTAPLARTQLEGAPPSGPVSRLTVCHHRPRERFKKLAQRVAVGRLMLP